MVLLSGRNSSSFLLLLDLFSMKIILVILFCCSSIHGFTQPQMVESAEISFARYAADSSIKKAFLKFLDPQSVVFDKGSVQKGMEIWNSVPETSNRLYWRPVFSVQALSGEMGFTTGPFELRPSSGGPLLRSGNYTSIWQKDSIGNWKVLLDIGTLYKPTLFETENQYTLSSSSLVAPKALSALQIEENFLNTLSLHGLSAYEDLLLQDSWMNADRMLPVKGKEAIIQALNRLPNDIQFHPLSGGISQSNDLAYVYGFVKTKDRTENYLRIWLHAADGWKILVQVIKW